VGPDVLIVGDASLRGELITQVRECGYEAAICPVRGLNRAVQGAQPPAAILICIDDVEADIVLAGLRRTRRGAAIPVILVGSLGVGRLGSGVEGLADVLDLGADQLVEFPTDVATLRPIFAELIGPASGATETAVVPRSERSTTRGVREISDDTVLGDLRQTLDRLEARLRRRDEDDPESDPRDDVDLAVMGLDEVPEVDIDGPSESGSRYATSTIEIDPERSSPGARSESTGTGRGVTRL
jgi:hypothetical protein